MLYANPYIKYSSDLKYNNNISPGIALILTEKVGAESGQTRHTVSCSLERNKIFHCYTDRQTDRQTDRGKEGGGERKIEKGEKCCLLALHSLLGGCRIYLSWSLTLEKIYQELRTLADY